MVDTGERIARVETSMENIKEEMINLKEDMKEIKGIVNDIKVAILGDGKQSEGIVSRVKSLEDFQMNKDKFNVWKYRILYIIISILTGLSGYLFFFK